MEFDVRDWVSVFMAFIAAASAITTFLVYRTAVDPNVIVYASLDENRLGLISLFIKNIGKGSAANITFKPSSPIPFRALGMYAPESDFAPMTKGPFFSGVPYLAPEQEIEIMWGQMGGLKEHIGKKPITIEVSYFRPTRFMNLESPLISTSIVDINQFSISLEPENHLKAISDAFKKTNGKLEKIEKQLAKIAKKTA